MDRFARATTASIKEAFARMSAAHHLVLAIVPDGTGGADVAGDGEDGGAGPGEDDGEEGAADVDVNDISGPIR